MISIRTITPKQNMSNNEVLEKLKWLDVKPEMQDYINIWLREISYRLYSKDKQIKQLEEIKIEKFKKM